MKKIWTIGPYYGPDQGFMQDSCMEEVEGGRRRKEKDRPLIRRGPIRPALFIGFKRASMGHGI